MAVPFENCQKIAQAVANVKLRWTLPDMTLSEEAFPQAEIRAQEPRQAGYVVAARYDRRTGRVVVKLNTEVQISFPPRLAEGLAGAAPEDLAVIEISPSGLGLHWPRLDADLYVPGLMAGQLGSKRWMTAQFGATGGRVRRAPRR